MMKKLTAIMATVMMLASAIPINSFAEESISARKSMILESLQKRTEEIAKTLGWTKYPEGMEPIVDGVPYNSNYCPKYSDFFYSGSHDHGYEYKTDWNRVTLTFSEKLDSERADEIENKLKEFFPAEQSYDSYGGYCSELENNGTFFAKGLNPKEFIEKSKEICEIESYEVEYGMAKYVYNWKDYGKTLMLHKGAFHAAESGSNLSPDAEISSAQDVLDFIANKTVDAEYGMLILKQYLPDGIEYEEPDEDMFSDATLYDTDAFAYIRLTPETALQTDIEIAKKAEAFLAIPHEETFENQCALMMELCKHLNVVTHSGIIAEMGGSELLGGVAIKSSEVLNGDANCDGKYTIADSTAILQALGNPDKYGLSLQGEFNADICNVGDGVTTMDALEVQKAMASKG